MAATDDDVFSPAPPPDQPRAVTRYAYVATVMFLAALLVVSARAEPTDTSPRTGRRVELVELIHAEQERARELEARVAELAARVAEVEAEQAEGGARLEAIQARIDAIAAAAGATAVRGPGVTAVLTDSALQTSPTGNLNDLVVHEQDLQAVINALWAGGAEAMSVNGQRILATTAIRCVGNTLLLHGGVYSPPYVITAIGDDVALQAELGRDHAVARFRAAAREYKLGFTVSVSDDVIIPAYDGATVLSVARPAGA